MGRCSLGHAPGIRTLTENLKANPRPAAAPTHSPVTWASCLVCAPVSSPEGWEAQHAGLRSGAGLGWAGLDCCLWDCGKVSGFSV